MLCILKKPLDCKGKIKNMKENLLPKRNILKDIRNNQKTYNGKD